MPIRIGDILNERYKIEEILGQGGFGRVYRVTDLRLERSVVIKESLTLTEQTAKQFDHEARLLAKLGHHPHLPAIHDYFSSVGQGHYLVMEYIEGPDLVDLLEQNNGPIPIAQALTWIDQVLDALEFLHNRQPPVIHRDIKPDNIKIHPERGAVLVDFGIAKVFDQTQGTLTALRAYSPGYAPWEQCVQGKTDVRTDIYSVGATLYAMLTGQRPVESIDRIEEEKLIPLHTLNPKISPVLESVVLRAMGSFARQRYQTAVEFRAALRGHPAISSDPTNPEQPSTAPSPINLSEATLARPAGTVVPGGTVVPVSLRTDTPIPALPLPAPTPRQAVITPQNAGKLKPIRELKLEELCHQIVWSPNGKLLAAAQGSGVHIYDPKTMQEVRFLEPRGQAYRLAFTHNGQTLASSMADSTIRLWDISDGAMLRVLKGHTDIINNIAFLLNGQVLASASRDNTIRMWRIADGKELRNLRPWGFFGGYDSDGRPYHLTCLAISHDGLWLASGSEDCIIRVWSAADGILWHKMKGHKAKVNCLAFSNDGLTLASGSEDKTIRLWRVKEGKPVSTLEVHTRMVNSLAFSPPTQANNEGLLLASGSSDSTIGLWRMSDGALQLTLKINNEVSCVSFSPDGTRLASLFDNSRNSTLQLWGLE